MTNQPLRLLLLNQFYPPDIAPTGQFLHDLAKELRIAGHQVTVYCSQRSYDGGAAFARRENIDGVDVQRIPAMGLGRKSYLTTFLDYASFYGLLAWRMLRHRDDFDVVLSLTTPPYIGCLGRMLATRRRLFHAHWVMDLYPDVMAAHDMLKGRIGGVVEAILRKATAWQLHDSDLTITLGPKMSERVERYTQGPTVSIPLWQEPSLAPWPEGRPNPLRQERGWAEGDTVFMYSGNMGLGHRFKEFLAASLQLGSTGPRWVYVGGGKRTVEIQKFAQQHPAARIEVRPYVERSRLRESLCAADVHLVSLDSKWQGLMVPSKLASIFAVGKPVIYIGGQNCEMAQWIQESGGGWVVPEGDVEGLLQVVAQALDPGERQRRGLAAKAYADTHFDFQINSQRMIKMIEQLALKPSQLGSAEGKGAHKDGGEQLPLTPPLNAIVVANRTQEKEYALGPKAG